MEVQISGQRRLNYWWLPCAVPAMRSLRRGTLLRPRSVLLSVDTATRVGLRGEKSTSNRTLFAAWAAGSNPLIAAASPPRISRLAKRGLVSIPFNPGRDCRSRRLYIGNSRLRAFPNDVAEIRQRALGWKVISFDRPAVETSSGVATAEEQLSGFDVEALGLCSGPIPKRKRDARPVLLPFQLQLSEGIPRPPKVHDSCECRCGTRSSANLRWWLRRSCST